jgi:hypothetical protein
MSGVQIVACLRRHYGEGALSRTHVYFWINEVKQGRTDLKTITGPGRKHDEGLATVIVGKLDANPHLSARKLAQPLGLAASSVCRYLTEAWGTKCQHLW